MNHEKHEKTRKKKSNTGHSDNTENSSRRRMDNGKHDGVIMPVPPVSVELPGDYANFLKQVKQRVKTERLKAVLSANAAQILLHWDIGHDILQKQKKAGWGAKVIDRLGYDLKKAFPEMNGFSARNLKYMRKFAEEWPEREIVQRTVAQIPWRSNLTLLEKLKGPELRLWYAEQTIANGWSKNILAVQIETKLHAALIESTAADQVSDQVTDQVARLVTILAKGEFSASELLAALGLPHRPTFRKNYINPALADGWIGRTMPDAPRSPAQRYRLTDKGRAWVKKRDIRRSENGS